MFEGTRIPYNPPNFGIPVSATHQLYALVARSAIATDTQKVPRPPTHMFGLCSTTQDPHYFAPTLVCTLVPSYPRGILAIPRWLLGVVSLYTGEVGRCTLVSWWYPRGILAVPRWLLGVVPLYTGGVGRCTLVSLEVCELKRELLGPASSPMARHVALTCAI